MIYQTAEEIDLDIAHRIKKIRKRKKITQLELSERCNVSYGSIKRFERTGEISLISLTRISICLECENELASLFTNVPYKNMDEVFNEQRYK